MGRPRNRPREEPARRGQGRVRANAPGSAPGMSPRGRRWHGRGPRGDETPGDRRTPVLDRASECRCPGRRPGPGQGRAWAAPGRECPRGSSLTRGERRSAQRQNGAHVCAGRGSPAPPGGPASAGVGGGASGRGRRWRSTEPAPRAATACGLGLLCGPGRRVHGAGAAEAAPRAGPVLAPAGPLPLPLRLRAPRAAWPLTAMAPAKSPPGEATLPSLHGSPRTLTNEPQLRGHGLSSHLWGRGGPRRPGRGDGTPQTLTGAGKDIGPVPPGTWGCHLPQPAAGRCLWKVRPAFCSVPLACL